MPSNPFRKRVTVPRLPLGTNLSRLTGSPPNFKQHLSNSTNELLPSSRHIYMYLLSKCSIKTPRKKTCAMRQSKDCPKLKVVYAYMYTYEVFKEGDGVYIYMRFLRGVRVYTYTYEVFKGCACVCICVHMRLLRPR